MFDRQRDSNTEQCAPGVHRLLTMMVNVYFVEDQAGGWTLVDAGLRGYTGVIRRTAERLFGSIRPSAIVLTHGHFDHIGALPALADEWAVPVYAHPLELPYLTGRSSYPPPDPGVGGGAWTLLSPTFPRGPIDLGPRVHMLPPDGSVPGLPAWKWYATPGHTAGHVSLFRHGDRVLLAGDAVVTTRQESFSCVMTQRPMVWRPPAYYTTDWHAAARSVAELASLDPEVLATGHGPSMIGAGMRRALDDLAAQFDAVVPVRGRYVERPAISDERGTVFVPPRPAPSAATVAVGVAALAAGAAMLAMAARQRHT
jgi:glyoxylase-like metal-dependent hydrolase (beta-lactamase superfamily II)